MKVFNSKKRKLSLVLDHVLRFVWRKRKKTAQKDRTILVFDFHLIGDIVLLTAFLKSLRSSYQHSYIVLVCGKWGAEILKYNPSIVNKVVVFGASWVTKRYGFYSIRYFFYIVKKLRRMNFDLGIEVRGDLRQIVMMSLCGVERLVGFSFTGGSTLLTEEVPDSGKLKHLIEHHKSLAKHLNCNLEQFYPEIWLSENEKKTIYAIQKNRGAAARVVGIHMGASNHLRQLPIHTAVNLINDLLEKQYHVVLYLVPGDERMNAMVMKCVKNKAIEVVNTSLRSYIVHLATCSIVISMDSGCGHLASAMGIPVIVVFGPGDPALSSPVAQTVGVVETPKAKIFCRPCDQAQCVHPIYKYCMETITSGMIVDKIREFEMYGGFRETL